MRRNYRVKELPELERPREKLLKYGAESLSDGELLAIIIRSGVKDRNVIDLSRQILKDFNGLSGLVRAHIGELSSYRGLGKVKSATVKAAIELGRRAYSSERSVERITSPEDVASIVWDELRYEKVEVFGILTLDVRGNVIGKHRVTRGGINFSSISPKEVFNPAVRDLAASVVLYHNHPSGDPNPSSEDIRTTSVLREAGRLLDIDVVDHIIFGLSKFFSFRREGLI